MLAVHRCYFCFKVNFLASKFDKKSSDMKQIFISGAVVLGLFLTACTAEVSTTENEGDAENVENVDETEATSDNMTCADLLNRVDDLMGKEVTVTATSWGTSNTMSGEVNLNLGDGKLEGMRQAPVVAKFAAEDAEAAKAIEKDQEVTIKATLSDYNYGAIELTNPTVVK